MYTEVVETQDNRRIVLVQDPDCEAPCNSNDGWVTTVLVENRANGMYHDTNVVDPSRRDALDWFVEYSRGAEAFVRWMRLYHGIDVQEVVWGSERHNALAWVESSELERVGLAQAPGHFDEGVVSSEVEQYNRWADGDTWGYVIEELTTWTNDATGVKLETWEETDERCFGFIGQEYAEEEARYAL